MKGSLNLSEAKALCNLYQNMVGLLFSEKSSEWGAVECVAVAPYDEINKHIFLEYYRQEGNAVRALRFYTVPYYDVVLIPRSTLDDKVTCCNVNEHYTMKKRVGEAEHA